MGLIVTAKWINSLKNLKIQELMDMAQMLAQNKKSFTDEAQIEMSIKFEYIRDALLKRGHEIVGWNEI